MYIGIYVDTYAEDFSLSLFLDVCVWICGISRLKRGKEAAGTRPVKFMRARIDEAEEGSAGKKMQTERVCTVWSGICYCMHRQIPRRL